jgi:hypothetical protein
VIRISIQLRKEDVLFSGAVECDRVKEGSTQVRAGYEDVACLGHANSGILLKTVLALTISPVVQFVHALVLGNDMFSGTLRSHYYSPALGFDCFLKTIQCTILRIFLAKHSRSSAGFG